MKTLNLIFSSLFLLWCITILILCNSDSHAKRLFHYGLGEKAFNFFWELVILATLFNILARLFNRCNFYLIGAFGMIALSLAQIFSVLLFFTKLIIGFSSFKEHDEHGARLLITILTFPYIIFGILSSLCCYQTKIHRRIDRTQSKLQKCFLQIPLTNYGRIVLCFNFMASISSLILFSIILVEKEFKYPQIICLFPIIPTIFFALALKFEKKCFFISAIYSWGFFICVFLASFLSVFFYHSITHEIPSFISSIANLSVCLIFVIHGFIGFFSALSIYHKIQKKNNQVGESFENQNFIVLQELNVNHQIEQQQKHQPQINVYSDVFDV